MLSCLESRGKGAISLLFLDGGSSDGTVEYAAGNGYSVYVQKEPGIRQAYLEVLPYIEGDVIITFSPDGNSIPELIPDLIAKIRDGYDMVIASRYLKNAKSEDDDPVTAFGNWFFTRTVNFLHGGEYTDVMVIFRAYKKQIIYDLDLRLGLAEKTFKVMAGNMVSVARKA